VRHAPLHRIHTFLASSDIHLEHKLGISRAKCLEISASMVAFARTMVDNVEFSPEDAGRSDPEFLVELCAAVIEAGATTINLPDTVGYTLPHEYAGMFAHLIANTPGGDKAIWSTHCHNDLGLATANSLAAVQSGARQVEVTLNSLGERAGNTSLEEVVMALRTRPAHFPVHCNIETKQIMRTSRMVATFTGIEVQPNKAIVGANAFAHESGIHQHGMLKNASTYEIITPESVGADSSGMLVLGKHSGKAAYKARLIELGYEDFANDAAKLDKLVEDAKAVADQKKVLSDDDLQALLGEAMMDGSSAADWKLESIAVQSNSSQPTNKLHATSTVTLTSPAGEDAMEVALGVGPVDATYKAIMRILNERVTLTQYRITKIHGGTNERSGGNDALASVVVNIQRERGDDEAQAPDASLSTEGQLAARMSHDLAQSRQGRDATYTGTGTSTDIITASAKAYIQAINRMLHAEQKQAEY